MKKINCEKVWKDLEHVLEKEPTIHTLDRKRPNKITSFSDEGIEVITQKSAPGSSLVPKWMFEEAVNYLSIHGSLSNFILLNELNVKRSSFVLAALSKLDYIGYSTKPLKIFLK